MKPIPTPALPLKGRVRTGKTKTKNPSHPGPPLEKEGEDGKNAG